MIVIKVFHHKTLRIVFEILIFVIYLSQFKEK